nr:TraR/DksA C4-type zinc finger protein [Brucella anthropi]
MRSAPRRCGGSCRLRSRPRGTTCKMKIGNWGHECADRLADKEREAGIEAARDALKRPGARFCSCGEEIEPQRRAAMPSATRCITCQERLERWRKLRRRK